MMLAVDEDLELRSIRRGGLTAMAQLGLPYEGIILFSQHRDTSIAPSLPVLGSSFDEDSQCPWSGDFDDFDGSILLLPRLTARPPTQVATGAHSALPLHVQQPPVGPVSWLLADELVYSVASGGRSQRLTAMCAPLPHCLRRSTFLKLHALPCLEAIPKSCFGPRLRRPRRRARTNGRLLSLRKTKHTAQSDWLAA
jgi:hypothetical protein